MANLSVYFILLVFSCSLSEFAKGQENDTPDIDGNDTPDSNEDDTPDSNEDDNPGSDEDDTPDSNEDDTPDSNEDDSITTTEEISTTDDPTEAATTPDANGVAVNAATPLHTSLCVNCIFVCIYCLTIGAYLP